MMELKFDDFFWSWVTRYAHVLVGIMWIGLLWYFNFVQIPNMAKIPRRAKTSNWKSYCPSSIILL